jgi:hypothetical protein
MKKCGLLALMFTCGVLSTGCGGASEGDVGVTSQALTTVALNVQPNTVCSGTFCIANSSDGLGGDPPPATLVSFEGVEGAVGEITMGVYHKNLNEVYETFSRTDYKKWEGEVNDTDEWPTHWLEVDITYDPTEPLTPTTYDVQTVGYVWH